MRSDIFSTPPANTQSSILPVVEFTWKINSQKLLEMAELPVRVDQFILKSPKMMTG